MLIKGHVVPIDIGKCPRAGEDHLPHAFGRYDTPEGYGIEFCPGRGPGEAVILQKGDPYNFTIARCPMGTEPYDVYKLPWV